MRFVLLTLTAIFANLNWSGACFGQDARSINLGTINGERITFDEFSSALHEVEIKCFLMRGVWPDEDKTRKTFEDDRDTYLRLQMLHAAKDMKIRGNPEIVSQVTSNVFASLAERGVSRVAFVKQMQVAHGLNEADFDRFISNEVIISDLVVQVGKTAASVTTDEARSAYRAEYEEVVSEIVPFLADDYLSRITVAPKAVDAFFQNNLALYRQSNGVPSLDSIREQVTGDFQKNEATLMARREGITFLAKLNAGLAQGKRFSELCADAGFRPVATTPVSRRSKTCPEIEQFMPLGLFQYQVVEKKIGTECVFIPTQQGGVIVHVLIRQPPNEDTMKSQLPNFAAELQQTRQQSTFNDWLFDRVKRFSSSEYELALKNNYSISQLVRTTPSPKQLSPIVTISILVLLWLWGSLCFYRIAQKAGVEPKWLAWIPVVNLYLGCRIARWPGWWFVLCYIPIIGQVFTLILLCRIPPAVGITDRRRFLMLIPVFNIFYLGYLAFGRVSISTSGENL